MQYYISRVRMTSFRSVRSEIEVAFQPGLNVIVGSNGVGKSTLLDAVRFAFAAPTKSFGGKLEALRNSSGTGEVCEVEVFLKRRNGGPSSKAAAQVAVCATLTPDNTRVYRLQGKLASGMEVRKYLRSIGINMEAPSSLIKQDAVTQLADEEDPKLLGAVVAEISGLAAWNQETAAAQLEIQRNIRDAEIIQQRIAQLRIQGERAQTEITAAEKRHQLEEALSKEAATMHALAQRVDTQISQELKAAEKLRTACIQSTQELEHRLSTASKRLADLESRRVTSDTHHLVTEENYEMCMQRVAVEEEISLLNENIRKQRELQEALETAEQDQRKATASHSHAVAALSAAKEAHASAKISLESTKDVSQGIMSSVHTLETALGQTQSKLDAARKRLVAAQNSLNQLPSQTDDAVVMEADPGALYIGSVQQDEAEVERLEQDVADLEWKVRSARQRIQAATRVLPGSTIELYPGMSPLHACFEFKNASECGQYSTALEVLVGKRLGVIIAPTAESAARFAGSTQGAGLRLWPLDMLASTDRLQRHRQAAAAFAPGEVLIPLDLVTCCESRYNSVLIRALGTHVIASTPEIAAELIERFGVSSVGLDGSVSSRGRLTGGWVSERQGHGPLHAKLHADRERQALAKLQNELDETAAKLNKMHRAIALHKEAVAARDAAAHNAEQRRAAGAKVTQAQAEVDEAEEIISNITAELVPQRALLKASMAAAGTEPAEFQAALQAESNRLRHRIVSLTEKVSALDATRIAAEDTVSCLNGKVVAAHIIESWQHRVLELGHKLHGLQRQALDAAQEDIDRQAAEHASHLDAIERAHRDASALQFDLSTKRDEADTLALRCKELEDMSLEISQLTLGAQDELFGERLYQPIDLQENLPTSLDELLQAAKSSHEKYSSLSLQLQESSTEGTGTGTATNVAEQRTRAEISQRLVDGFTEKCRVKQLTADNLTRGITSTDQLIFRVHDGVFGRARKIFQGLVNQALPGVEVDVVRVGTSLVQNGAQFRHRLGHAGEWRDGLASLSGGQRSIVCLAFILATRTAGSGQGAGVLMLDEVDAALDTSNQHLAATLMRSMCSASDGAPVRSTQVIAVSHNPAFQQVCDHVVKITRGEDGTRVEGIGAAGTSGGIGLGQAKSNGKRRKKMNDE